MTLADVCLGLVMVGITAYAVLGSADFGAGFWDLTAGGAHRGGRLRGMVQRSMSPVWEANHVWLIFVLVILWTCFPVAFGSVFSTLSIPLFLAALAAPVQVVVGDWAGRRVAETQPVKLAALEGLTRTRTGAPFTLGGFYDAGRGKVRYGIEVPKMLSLLAFHDPNATGNAVQAMTRQKMSQTWLASQTGLIERWTSPRTRPPRCAPPAVRSQKPAPKSALPRTA